MTATNNGYAGVRITSGTNAGASGNLVNVPLLASTAPSCRYPSWSLHEVFQSLRWYAMKKSPCSTATRHTIHRARRQSIAEILVQDLAVQRFDVVDKAIDAVSHGDGPAPALAHGRSARRIRQQREGQVGQHARIAGWRDE